MEVQSTLKNDLVSQIGKMTEINELQNTHMKLITTQKVKNPLLKM